MKLVITVLVILGAMYMANGLCNTCSATTGLACVADTKFKVCNDGLPSGSAIDCPTGNICTPGAQVCVPQGNARSSCARCKTCNPAKIFACSSYNSFTLCHGGITPDATLEYVCPGDLVCNVDASNICVDVALTGLGATCPWEEPITTTSTPETTTTTTPNPETQSDAFCALKAFPGRYDVTTDLKCQKYISCIKFGDKWTGSVYECPKGTNFNTVTQMCGIEASSRCS